MDWEGKNVLAPLGKIRRLESFTILECEGDNRFEVGLSYNSVKRSSLPFFILLILLL